MKMNQKPGLKQQLRLSPVMILAATSSVLAIAVAAIFSFNLFDVRSSFASDKTLNVKLVNFDAKAKGDAVQLQWATNGEDNVKSFFVERSGDNESFDHLATSNPEEGSDRATRFYVVNDLDPQTGMNYYNLVVEGSDGDQQKLASAEFVKYDAPTSDIQAYRLAKVVNFTATQNKDLVEINWATNGENGSKKFEVQKSVDGENFEKLGSMNAADLSTNSRVYTYSDLEPAKGVNYYKLMVYDANGDSYYCDAVAILFK